MDFLELASSRQSDRDFDPKLSVEDEKLRSIVEAARLAPSACNAQPWKIVVVTDPELRAEVAKAASGQGMNKFAKTAPVHLILVEDSANITSNIGSRLKGKYFPLMDIGILASYITLAAQSVGLGSCILGWFDEGKMKRLLGIPKNKRVLLDIVIGYSLKPTRQKKRKPLEQVVSYNTYK